MVEDRPSGENISKEKTPEQLENEAQNALGEALQKLTAGEINAEEFEKLVRPKAEEFRKANSDRELETDELQKVVDFAKESNKAKEEKK